MNFGPSSLGNQNTISRVIGTRAHNDAYFISLGATGRTVRSQASSRRSPISHVKLVVLSTVSRHHLNVLQVMMSSRHRVELYNFEDIFMYIAFFATRANSENAFMSASCSRCSRTP